MDKLYTAKKTVKGEIVHFKEQMLINSHLSLLLLEDQLAIQNPLPLFFKCRTKPVIRVTSKSCGGESQTLSSNEQKNRGYYFDGVFAVDSSLCL